MTGAAAVPGAASRSGRLIVVSNRLPLTLRQVEESWEATPSSGGLATALAPVLARTDGLWIGWPGEAPEPPQPARQEALGRWERERGLAPVDLPRGVAQRFYLGYANRTLWPVFHGFPSRFDFETAGWEAYVEANHRFRDAVLARWRPGDLVWVHDYHLLLLPRLLREARPEAAIGFFLHIPFPSSDLFRVLPRRADLLQGLLGADCIAFQTHRHLSHFRASLLRILGLASRMDQVDVDGRAVHLEAAPIGIVPEEFTGRLRSDPEVAASLADLHQRFADRRILLSVDRLDYTKGIPERLRSYRRLLERAPSLRGTVTLVQVAVPTREHIPRYREVREQVDRLVGEINGAYGTPLWTPVVYIRRAIPRQELVALYAAAAACWVSPLRDGMNLVAKEYVACQRGGEGVLVLSEFAGAAAEMGEALLVNPYDEDETASTVERALLMPAEERRERMAALGSRVERNNAVAWSERFLADLERAAAGRARQERPAPLPVAQALDAYRAARRRLLLLDYDGTLVGFASRPAEAAPPPGLVRLLAALVGRPGLRLALLSGRPRRELDAWFGHVGGLWLGAEHGAVLRDPQRGVWEPLRPNLPVEWKSRVLPVLDHYVDRTPGSFVEEKEYSVVWHYRMSDPEFAEWLANDLVATLDELLAETELRAVRGHKSVEVRLAWANKGEAVRRLESDWPEAGFVLGAGDDRTDEDMFERLGAAAWTVHVGEGPSRARFRLASPAQVVSLVEALAGAER